jgi:hypothetical protein
MTDQHRATPEQWKTIKHYVIAIPNPSIASCLLELRARVEALETALAVLAESHRFCTDAIVRRVEALELAHRIQSGTLTSAERAELGVVTRVQLEAAMLRSASDARQAAMTEPHPASSTHAMTDEQLKIARELTLASCNTLTTIPKITTNYETFVLLECWYEGDSNLVSDSFVACGDIENLKLLVPPEAELFMPWENVPDDGHYGDKRKRFRIALTPFLQEFNPPHALPIPASAEARPAGGLVERVAARIEYGIDAELDPEGIAHAAIREVAAAASQMHPDKNLTWERVAQWLELEASQ